MKLKLSRPIMIIIHVHKSYIYIVHVTTKFDGNIIFAIFHISLSCPTAYFNNITDRLLGKKHIPCLQYRHLWLFLLQSILFCHKGWYTPQLCASHQWEDTQASHKQLLMMKTPDSWCWTLPSTVHCSKYFKEWWQCFFPCFCNTRLVETLQTILEKRIWLLLHVLLILITTITTTTNHNNINNNNNHNLTITNKNKNNVKTIIFKNFLTITVFPTYFKNSLGGFKGFYMYFWSIIGLKTLLSWSVIASKLRPWFIMRPKNCLWFVIKP